MNQHRRRRSVKKELGSEPISEEELEKKAKLGKELAKFGQLFKLKSSALGRFKRARKFLS